VRAPDGRVSITSISLPLVSPNAGSPTSADSGDNVTHEPERDLVRRVWEVLGMPVTGSSLAFRVEIGQMGVTRRSAESRGVAGTVDVDSAVDESTVMRREMSWGVMRDIVE